MFPPRRPCSIFGPMIYAPIPYGTDSTFSASRFSLSLRSVGVLTVLLIARFAIYPHSTLARLTGVPLVIVSGQALAYLLVLAYMYILVTRERHRPDFLAAIHWNWPPFPAVYVLVGFMLSVALQILASRLPIPKNLPIDTFFRTPAEAWALTIFGITLDRK